MNWLEIEGFLGIGFRSFCTPSRRIYGFYSWRRVSRIQLAHDVAKALKARSIEEVFVF